MKKYLWIGSFVGNEIKQVVNAYGYKNPASEKSQANIIFGLEANLEITFDCMSCLSMKGYPYNRNIKIQDVTFSHRENAQDMLIGYCNIAYYNKLSSKYHLVQKVKKWAEDNKNNEVEIFVYEMRTACLAAATICKRMVTKARIHLIVPDLPEYMDLNMNFLKKLLKKADWNKMKTYLSDVDDYILYTKPMVQYLGIENKKWLLMEGSFSDDYFKDKYGDGEQLSSSKKSTIVMYSGGVQKGFGIKNLLDAFSYLDEGFELWITGSGDANEIVSSYSSIDQRIKFFGYLPTIEELVKLQKQADMFVNMRDPNSSASRYCFPSKLFEYMLSGKPVLSFRLDGIPEEYYKHLVLMKSDDPKDIAESIKKVATMSSDELEGLNARRFILDNKNNIYQTKRIADFIRA